MSLTGLTITVGTTATILSQTSGFSDTITYNLNGQSVLIQNPSSSTKVYVGGPNVSSSVYGYELLPGQSISIDLSGGEHIYAAVVSGTQAVNVIRRGI
jgi:archaellum component FlaF (FlaF/FlaG flagellin family)